MTGYVLLRARAHRLLVGAAFLAIVLSACVLSTLTAFGNTVDDAGMSHSLDHRSVARTVLDVNATVTAEDRAEIDAAVRTRAAEVFDPLPSTVESSTRSGPYALPAALGNDQRTGAREAAAEDGPEGGAGADGGTGAEQPDLTLLTTFERARMELVEGDWPRPVRSTAPDAAPDAGRAADADADAVTVVLPESAAHLLGVSVGDRIDLTARLSGQPPVQVLVTGVYRPKDSTHPYWRTDPLGTRGIRSSDFTTYGPLVVDDSVFASGRVAPQEARWQADADFSGLTSDSIGSLREAVSAAVEEFQADGPASGAVAASELPRLLDSLERSLLVTRSTLLVGTVQLLVLTGLALALVAGLLATQRAEETALLRARGASRRRLAALAATEALVLVAPAALVAPLLAGPLTGWLAERGTLGGSELTLDTSVPATAWWMAALTALLCAAALVAPALRRVEPDSAGGRTRSGARGAVVRGGADLALVVLAGVAYWQLVRRSGDGGSGVLSADTEGALGIDPVLVAAPALALLSGAVLALRLLPFLARLGEKLARRGRGLVTPLVGWQLSRRARHAATPALLLALAVAMAVLAVGQGASWERSQRDQAAHRVGADLLVTDSATPGFGQGGRFDAVDDITAAVPFARASYPVRDGVEASVLAADLGPDGALPTLRGDLADAPLSTLLAGGDDSTHDATDDSGGGPAKLSGPTVDAAADALRLTVRLTALDPRGQPTDSAMSTALTLYLTDRHGVVQRFPLGDVPADGRDHPLTADLAAARGEVGRPAGPLRVSLLTADYVPQERSEEHRLTVRSLRASGGPAGSDEAEVTVDEGLAWDHELRVDDPQRRLRSGDGERPEVSEVSAAPDAPLTLRYTTGSLAALDTWGSPTTATLLLAATTGAGPGSDAATGSPLTGDAPLTAVATDDFLAASGAEVGQEVKVRISGSELTVRITGAVRDLPSAGAQGAPDGSTDPTAADGSTAPSNSTGGDDGGALLLDLAAVNQALLADQSRPVAPDGWWLATAPGTDQRVAEELRAEPGLGTVTARSELVDELLRDPLGSGPRTALTAIAVAAALLAATGFAVSTAGALRERAREYVVLRALGATRRDLSWVIAAEHAVVVLLSLAVGAALGTVLTRLVLPLVVLTADAGPPQPPLLVELPLGQLGLLLATVAAGPLLAVAVVTLRRGGPAVAAARALRARGEN